MDAAYQDLPRPTGELAHDYGPRVHLLSQPWALSVLARLCRPETVQPTVDHLISALYDWMLPFAASRVLQTAPRSVVTRMAEHHPAEGVIAGELVDPGQRVVVVDIARGGILPSARLYQGLHAVLDPWQVRQDHIVASRTHDASGQVTGVAINTTKMGGPVAGATVLVPDPMAATGTSIAAVARRYLDDPGGPPRALVALHLIVTPEYLRRITTELPEVEVFAIRLDRGLSPADVLAARPGARWDEERGLNEQGYIVPGAGGLGEVMNNAWV